MNRSARNRNVQSRLLAWYEKNQRDLPWRKTRDPYAILISEVMLQQTQVDRVIPKYYVWLRMFPTVQSLARAPLRKVLRLWSGLGYNNRGVRLRQAARVIVEQHGGLFPRQHDVLKGLPGVGEYTAAAVTAFAGNQRAGIMDTNVRRVISRVFFGLKEVTEKRLKLKVDELVPAPNRYGEWHHAVMDLGAMVCVSRRPKCAVCPLRKHCRAYPGILTVDRPRQAGRPRFKETNRFWRGEIIRQLLRHHSQGMLMLHQGLKKHGRLPKSRFQTLLRALAKDGLIQINGHQARLRA